MDHTQKQTLGDDDLYDFLTSAPKYFRDGERIKKFQLKNGDYIHCVLWNCHFHITGTDIVKILTWRFQNSGRPMGNMKKFEEGIFSDLRNLKPGIDATLEGPRSDFLEFLYKNGCVRTQKKQKVFYWYSVPHDALFCDAIERDLRRDTSIYTYNTFVGDGRRPSIPLYGSHSLPAIGSECSAPMFSGFDSRKIAHAPRSMEESRLFDIGISLFGDQRKKANAASRSYEGLITKDISYDSIQPLSFESKEPMQSIPQYVDYEDEAKKDRLKDKYNFDSFDLEQLGFLKERCQEHLRFSQESCEKKKLAGESQDTGSTGKVRFVGPGSTDRD